VVISNNTVDVRVNCVRIPVYHVRPIKKLKQIQYLIVLFVTRDKHKAEFHSTPYSDGIAHAMSPLPENPRPTIDIESLRLQLSNLVARMKSNVSLRTLRPLPIFLGLQGTDEEGVELSTNAFNPPLAGSGTMAMVKSRVKDNLKFFVSNYALLAAMTALVVMLMHPSKLFALAFICIMWWCHGYLIKHELVVFGLQIHAMLTVQQRFYVMFAISAIIIVWECFIPTIIFIMISGFIILCHAALRDTSHLHEASQRGLKHHDKGGEEGNEVDALLSNV
jgi:hypothetical protein